MGVFTQVASNIKGFARKFACCVNGAKLTSLKTRVSAFESASLSEATSFLWVAFTLENVKNLCDVLGQIVPNRPWGQTTLREFFLEKKKLHDFLNCLNYGIHFLKNAQCGSAFTLLWDGSSKMTGPQLKGGGISPPDKAKGGICGITLTLSFSAPVISMHFSPGLWLFSLKLLLDPVFGFTWNSHLCRK